MRMIMLDDLKPGMKLAKTIYREDDGGVLLRANIELKPTYIDRIKELKYTHIYVLDEGDSEEAVIREPISEETRFQARAFLKKAVAQMENEETVSLTKLAKIVEELIDQVFSDINIVSGSLDIRSPENYQYAHSVNVCIISLMIGSVYGLNRLELSKLGIGAMLHDVGMVYNDSRANKKLNLNFQETDLMKTHPRIGYELIKRKTTLNFLSAHVALQHHEREDGSGFPRGLTSKRIHRYSKIVAVADAYDTLIHRGFQQKVLPEQAIRAIKAKTDQFFDAEVVAGFLKVAVPFPIGSILVLNNGETVLIQSVSRSECQAKVIAPHTSTAVYNLYQEPKLSVVKFLN
ncbi:MAG TPA: HD domain-containing phosphohydrolase [Bacillota bacterium]|nr:HD domain-containing phosphohydrolase [Bacillota bacterium]